MTTDPPHLLQLCPNDLPPFAALCEVYARAAQELGATCETWFLEPRANTSATTNAAPKSQSNTHNRQFLLDARGAKKALPNRLVERVSNATPTLALCHRYRSFRVLQSSRLQPAHKVVVAHEFDLFKRWRRRAHYKLFAQDTVFAGVSAAVSQQLATTTGTAVTLPNAIDHDRVAADRLDRPAARQALGLLSPPEVCHVGVVGRLHPKKRPALALDVCRESKTPTHLVYVGDGDLAAELQTAAKDCAQRVTFSGFVPDAPRTLAALDLLLMTSSEVEAFGMVALEALAAGVPVIAPNIPGPVSVLGELGFYFEQGANDTQTVGNARIALERAQDLLQGPKLRTWRERAAARVAAEFSVAATARRLSTWLN